MRILAIETSCDETAAAIVEDGRKIITNIVASSKELHGKTGGIIPEVAAREQVRCIIPVIQEAIKQSSNQAIAPNNKKNSIALSLNSFIASKIDAIAVTIGPGLIGSLLVGVETAKTIAFVTGKPIIPVNHIFAHIYANWLTPQLPCFPAIALVVSGGHTELFLMKGHGKLKWLGGTLDDAAGEAFDKTARLLGLSFPGGPAIAAAAAQYQKSKIKNQKYQIELPRPMINSGNLNFSFSGLKTAVIRELKKIKNSHSNNTYYYSEDEKLIINNSRELVRYFADEIQEAITDVLVVKTIRAAQQFKVKSILLGGGVAANDCLRQKFKVNFWAPPKNLCTDNAAYIGSFAYFNYKPLPWPKIQAQPDLGVEV